MARSLSVPRVLPMTIAVMTVLLVVKSVALVRAAVPETAHAATTAPPSDASGKSEAPKPAVVGQPAVPLAKGSEPLPAPVASGPPDISDSERALLLDLRGRRAELDARAAALSARNAVLDAAEKRLAARVDELSRLQASLETLEKARRERDNANWGSMVKLYEAMKPRDAAVIFNDLDMPVLLQVLDRMKETKAAPVLAAMQPERARLATTQLAQMRTRTTTTPDAGKPGG